MVHDFPEDSELFAQIKRLRDELDAAYADGDRCLNEFEDEREMRRKSVERIKELRIDIEDLLTELDKPGLWITGSEGRR